MCTKYCMVCAYSKNISLFICNSNLTVHLIFLFARSGNPTWEPEYRTKAWPIESPFLHFEYKSSDTETQQPFRIPLASDSGVGGIRCPVIAVLVPGMVSSMQWQWWPGGQWELQQQHPDQTFFWGITLFPIHFLSLFSALPIKSCQLPDTFLYIPFFTF